MSRRDPCLAVSPFAAAFGEPIQVEIQALPSAPARVEVWWRTPRQAVCGHAMASLDVNGAGSLAVALGDRMAEGTVNFEAPLPGRTRALSAAASVHPREAAEEMRALAAAIETPAACRLVFAGDSLTAMNLGSNYVSLVERALLAKLRDRPHVVNAGVGGDTIERVEARLAREVIERQPDWVFVFVGHNDSKIAWDPKRRDYGECFVPLDRFEASYRRVLSALRDAGVGRRVVISASASYEPVTRAIHQRNAAEGKPHNFFGRPDLLEGHNAAAQRAAAACGADYLDLYVPMKASPEWPRLTDASGVHLTEAGDRFVAVQVLRYLAAAMSPSRPS